MRLVCETIFFGSGLLAQRFGNGLLGLIVAAATRGKHHKDNWCECTKKSAHAVLPTHVERYPFVNPYAKIKMQNARHTGGIQESLNFLDFDSGGIDAILIIVWCFVDVFARRFETAHALYDKWWIIVVSTT